MNLKIEIEQEDDGRWIAEVSDLPGVMHYGLTRAEAVAKVEEAVARVQREPAPDPYKEDWYALSSKHLQEGHGTP